MAKSVIYNGYFRCRAACAQWRALGGSLQGWAHRRTWPAPLRVTGRDGACIRLEWARVADDGVGMSFTAPRMHAWPCCRASFRHGFVELQKRQNAPAAGKTGLIVQSNLPRWQLHPVQSVIFKDLRESQYNESSQTFRPKVGKTCPRTCINCSWQVLLSQQPIPRCPHPRGRAP